MPLSNPDLWQKIADWPLPYRAERDDGTDPPRDCTCFEHNLRKLGDWTDDAASQITEVYRKFLYLKALTGETLTPPRWIDQAWHLHLEFEDDYRALETVLGRNIPHQTGISGTDALVAYAQARALLLREFEALPEARLWPAPWQGRSLPIAWAIICSGSAIFFGAMVASLVSDEPPKSWVIFGGWAIGLIGMIFGNTAQYLWAPATLSRCG